MKKTMSNRKVDFVFYILRSKYCSWWEKRDIIPNERMVWNEKLSRYSYKQIKEAVYRCRERWQYRPPSPNEFTEFMDELSNRPFDVVTGQRFDKPEHSDLSKKFFDDFNSVFGK